jgi:hypothetical protein
MDGNEILYEIVHIIFFISHVLVYFHIKIYVLVYHCK